MILLWNDLLPFVSFIIFSYTLDENLSTGVSSEFYDLLMQKWQQNSYCFMSRTFASICSDNSPERYSYVRLKCGKFPPSLLAGDQGLGLAAAFPREASPVTEAFLPETFLCKVPPPHYISDVLQFPSYFLILHSEVSLINRLTFPVGSIYH
jgi:hypothetical protein